ncbi:hypothetical protein GCM10011332_19880 [Terasakiella brassicae]|uniref:ATP-binding protein n=1 Tax=Terasakiella brassicae TaxID=1634917 RepID=A0A917C1B8_9PROT|nr:hypothetical protein [Terasakiella brassicae]GGF65811.1 hypothetical protein GCM10011332_19880 [Terasakiella brassicae]
MHKLSQNQFERLDRIAPIRHKRRLKELEKRRQRRGGAGNKLHEIACRYRVTIRPSYNVSGKQSAQELDLPEHINLAADRNDLIAFVEALRDVMYETHYKVTLNFHNVKTVGGAGLLYLASEIYRMTTFKPNRINGNYPLEKDVLALMQDLGFFRMLGVQELLPSLNHDDERFRLMGFKTGTRLLQSQIGELQDKIIDGVEGISEELTETVYSVMVEAMQNVLDHAYTDVNGKRRQFPHLRMYGRWWVGAYLNRESKKLLFMMCDHGAGIPATVPETAETVGGLKFLLQKAGIVKPSDANYIKIATQYGQSQTGLSNRGKGLAKMRTFAGLFPTGELRIISGRGEYRFFNDVDGEKEETSDHSKAIEGTIVLWSLNYGAESGNADDYD